MKSKVLMVLAVVLFVGCKSVKDLSSNTFEYRKLTSYKIGERSVSSVGEPIIIFAKGVVMPVLQSRQNTSLWDYSLAPNKLIVDKNEIFKGCFKAVINGEPRILFGDKNCDFLKDNLNSKSSYAIITDTAYNPIGIYNSGYDYEIINPDALVLVSINEPRAMDMYHEIIYSGKSGNTVKAVYREYSNGMARSSFSQELEWDLSASDIVQYRDIKIKIHEADGSKITYEVIEDNDLGWLR